MSSHTFQLTTPATVRVEKAQVSGSQKEWIEQPLTDVLTKQDPNTRGAYWVRVAPSEPGTKHSSFTLDVDNRYNLWYQQADDDEPRHRPNNSIIPTTIDSSRTRHFILYVASNAAEVSRAT